MSTSMSTPERIAQIRSLAQEAIDQAQSTEELERVRIGHLGRKAELPNLLRNVAQLEPQERSATGKAANEARQALEQAIEAKAGELATRELERRLLEDRVDVTLPADPLPAIGRLHLLTATRREIEDVFVGLGFNVAEGPEVETVYYNFDALNHDITHPARARTDTFYVDRDLVLRTHTSPMQVRAMERQAPPLYIIVPGRVYRPDSDATHTPQFHQIEGLAVDTDVTLADLKGTLLAFARAIFGHQREVRLRPHYFPFTEPSVEVDVSCFHCTDGIVGAPRASGCEPGAPRASGCEPGAPRASGCEPVVGERCPLCKGTAWIEILGAGMVDPNVFEHVRAHGYDPERVQGFAFGMGIERIAMLKHGVPDLRVFYDNDIRFLEQFG